MARPTNTQFALAVHTLTLLASDPRPLSSDALAARVRSHPAHIRRVLGHLRRAGLVGSRPGPHGGWQLRHRPAEITLADAWRAVQRSDRLLGLPGPDPAVATGQAIERALLALDRRAQSAVEHELARTTIAELVAETVPRQLQPA